MSSNIYIKLFNESIGHCEQIETNNGNEYGMHDYDHEYLHISFKEFYANENLFEILPKLPKNFNEDYRRNILIFYPLTGSLCFYKIGNGKFDDWEKIYSTTISLKNLTIGEK